MKTLLDLNLSFRLVEVLLPLFPGSRHVRDFGFTGDDDERIWNLAKDEGFVIVTKDNDFLARALVRGHPPQVVQICVGIHLPMRSRNYSSPAAQRSSSSWPRTGSRCSWCVGSDNAMTTQRC